MAIGTANRLLTASPPIPTASHLRFSPHIAIPSPFPHHSLSIILKPTLPRSFRHNCKHLTLTPCSLSSSIAFSPPPKIPTLSRLPPLDFSHLTPLTICRYSAVVAFIITAAKKTAEILFSPFFWLYFSWTWLFWPWVLAFSLAFYGLYSATRYSIGQATIVEQLAIVTSTVAWLTLVPPAHFNGFLEGWPFVLFFVYHYFFFFESSVRKRLYGDLLNRDHDAKWDIGLPKSLQIGFFVLVLIGHWLAAYEGVELHLISGGWANFSICVLIATALFLRYHSVLYLAKYSEKVSVPTTVVQFGPYRWVRHPIYASTMLLFAIHCITLRAPLSLLFLVVVCLAYYGKKAELEEAILVESFGDMYEEYRKKVLN
ncbi:protein-S-isoprenylcysteine O-methyltransferase isoform X2 [Phalaenopsis equestris]|uniref:protein-S-isoprenylcysteine O-methyltransferase isoform X2 n=1 Tax=Phalaenopsis equestris TaxID=78828 RepID=UPI0009E5D991|nr:protein-S-isoprenylcysteine O-methyltransferase isoform X2 [Phalaenopsis equestris]